MIENFGVDIPVENLIYRAKEIVTLLKQKTVKQDEARTQTVT
jgi:hypothetical protein